MPYALARGAEAHHLVVVSGRDDAFFGAALRADHVTEHQLPWRGRNSRAFLGHWVSLDCQMMPPELRMTREADGQPSMGLLVMKLSNLRNCANRDVIPDTD